MAEQNENTAFAVEDAMKRIEEITKQLEDPEATLSDSLKVYAEGVELVNACRKRLCDVEKEMMILDGEQSENE